MFVFDCNLVELPIVVHESQDSILLVDEKDC